MLNLQINSQRLQLEYPWPCTRTRDAQSRQNQGKVSWAKGVRREALCGKKKKTILFLTSVDPLKYLVSFGKKRGKCQQPTVRTLKLPSDPPRPRATHKILLEVPLHQVALLLAKLMLFGCLILQQIKSTGFKFVCLIFFLRIYKPEPSITGSYLPRKRSMLHITFGP